MSNCKILEKKNNLSFGPKTAYLDIFGLEFYKYNCHISNELSQVCVIANFCRKKQTIKVFDQKCYILVFLGWNFKKAIVIFEISTLDFA